MLGLISFASASVPTEFVMPMSDRLAYALRMLVVGLGMVFVVLAILWGVLVLSHVLLAKITGEKKPAAPKKEAKVAPAAPQSVAAAPAPVSGDAVLIAVITAAIQAAMEEQGSVPAGGFRVVSFRPASGHRGWNNQ